MEYYSFTLKASASSMSDVCKTWGGQDLQYLSRNELQFKEYYGHFYVLSLFGFDTALMILAHLWCVLGVSIHISVKAGPLMHQLYQKRRFIKAKRCIFYYR